MREIVRFLKRVVNLIRWFPIIWKDQDWDHHFIFDILKFKLKNQAEYIGQHDRHMRAKRDAEIIMTCVRLIDKIQNEWYGCEYQDYHDCEYDFIQIPGTDSYELELNEKSENFDEYFKKYPLVFKRVSSPEDSKMRNALKVSRENHNRARRLLFKIMEERIEGWWD